MRRGLHGSDLFVQWIPCVLNWIQFRKCEVKPPPWTLCLCSSNQSWRAYYSAERGHCCLEMLFLLTGVIYNKAEVGHPCQSNIYMNGRAQGFSAQHWTHHNDSWLNNGLPSSWCAGWDGSLAVLQLQHPIQPAEMQCSDISLQLALTFWQFLLS